VSDDAAQGAALSTILALLGEKHGIGERSGAWVTSRLEHALQQLVAETGSLERAVDLVRADRGRLAQLADCLRVGETRFYRDPDQWAALDGLARSTWLSGGRVRALSVGCSSGQEALTLAMVLDAARKDTGKTSATLRVVGIDKSGTAIETARDGVYSPDALDPLPRALREHYFEVTDVGLKASAELRAIVSFSVRDALVGPPPGLWELAICKNMLIYLSDDAAERVVTSLLRSLSDDGVLLVARSEVARVRALGHAAEELAPGVTVFRA
jgi:chemotaxis methyl-accepting protein methylase